MKKASALLAASLTGLVMITMSATQLAAAGFENFGRAGAWHVSGQQGQCEIGRGLEAGQMEFVLSRDGTVITLQSLTWTRMRQPRSNMFKVTVYFDNKNSSGPMPSSSRRSVPFRFSSWMRQTRNAKDNSGKHSPDQRKCRWRYRSSQIGCASAYPGSPGHTEFSPNALNDISKASHYLFDELNPRRDRSAHALPAGFPVPKG